MAFEALLEREFVSAYELADLYEAAHLSLVPTLLSRVGARSSDENAAALGAMLGVLPEADVLVLTELAQMGKTVRHPLDAHVLERTRSYLWKQDPSLLVAAILAVDRMGDGAAVPTLADLLEHEHPNVRKHAHAALTTITREHLGHQREVWSDWYKSEQRWWRQQAPALIGEVRDRRHGVASRALLELSRHRLFRHELVDPVAHGLTHAEPEVVILACATLGHLGSPQSIRPLAVMLDEHGLEIRRAALLALRRLTGADHGEESDGWLATLDGAR